MEQHSDPVVQAVPSILHCGWQVPLTQLVEQQSVLAVQLWPSTLQVGETWQVPLQ